MRRVRNHGNHSTNPGLMFAIGVEQIVRDQISHQSRFDHQQMEELKRTAIKQEPRGNLFSALLKQFAF